MEQNLDTPTYFQKLHEFYRHLTAVPSMITGKVLGRQLYFNSRVINTPLSNFAIGMTYSITFLPVSILAAILICLAKAFVFGGGWLYQYGFGQKLGEVRG